MNLEYTDLDSIEDESLRNIAKRLGECLQRRNDGTGAKRERKLKTNWIGSCAEHARRRGKDGKGKKTKRECHSANPKRSPQVLEKPSEGKENITVIFAISFGRVGGLVEVLTKA